MASKIELHLGDCLEILKGLDVAMIDAVVSDPPYGMDWNTDSSRFSGGVNGDKRYQLQGRDDWGSIKEDAKPFDPARWLSFPKVVLWGSNHYAQKLPVGTTLVWLKKEQHLYGSFLSDAEIAWQKGGYGVYCFQKNFPPPSRIREGGGKCAHPTQKPVALMEWCIDRLKLNPGSTILDPYMGSGTTGIAAMRLGMNFIGIELDPVHFATAKRRIAAERNENGLLYSLMEAEAAHA